MKTDITLKEFYQVWYMLNKERMGLSPSPFHKEILEFLDDSDNWTNHTGVLQVFRSGAKSTIVALYVTYLLVKDPSTTIIVQSADDRTAIKILRGVQDLIKSHPFALHLAQTEREWQKGTFFVAGATDPQNPSVSGYGIRSNITGRRAHYMIYDDVEAKSNVNTDDKRTEIRNRIAEGINILHPKGKRLFVGTPHNYDTIYDRIMQTGATSLKIPILRDAKGVWPKMTGTPVWPERFDIAEINKKQSSVPEHEWQSQNMLKPWNMHKTVLDPNKLNVYDSAIEYMEANGDRLLRINGNKLLSCTAYWDVSSGKVGSDDAVLAVVFTSETGSYYIHKAEKLIGSLDDQCRRIKEIALECLLPAVHVETNGVGVFAPRALGQYLEGTGVSVIPQYQSQKKNDRILSAFQKRLHGYLYCHTDVYRSPFKTQMRDWTYNQTSKKDDYIDAVASAIELEPIRLNLSGLTAVRRNAVWGNYDDSVDQTPVYNPFSK